MHDQIKTQRRDFLTKSVTMLSAMALPSAAFSNGELNDTKQVNSVSELKIRRLSWAGVHLEYDGASLFIDPVISKEIWDGKAPFAIVPPETTTGANHVAITHIHNDHFDVAAIKAIYGEKRASIFCSERSAPVIAAHHIPEIRVTPLWEPFFLSAGKFTLIAIPAQDFTGLEQVSWVIKAGGKTIYHGGDSMWHGNFHKVSFAFGPFDAAFLPINGFDHLALQPHSHMNCSLTPMQAAAAGKVLRAKVVVPIHYGINDPEGGYIEFPNVEKAMVEECKKVNVGLEINEPGTWITWKPNR
jgi:L-ascorbate metabolism protein UlaG (beta-lactamase superfamily)